jgi:two-component system, chemotaxis family, response regulator Rcp1
LFEFATPTGIPPAQPGLSDEVQPDQVEEPFRAFRVLLVEDNAADVMVVEEILQQQSVRFEITVARDGQQAIQLLQGLDANTSLERFDIALLDLNLPKHTGHEVLAVLRKTKRSGDIPVIIVTSSRSPSDIKRARELGATEYFEKVADLDAYSALGSLVIRTLDRIDSAKS